MNQPYVPSAGELTAHARTAVDGAVRWTDRALRTGPGDLDAWERDTFYARMILMRGLERGEMLGWVLERDALAAEDLDRNIALQSARSYWAEARDALHQGRELLGRAADLPPATAVPTLGEARAQLYDGGEWLAHVAEGLARSSRSVVIDLEARDLAVDADRSHGLDIS